jgi:hypothetical protein
LKALQQIELTAALNEIYSFEHAGLFYRSQLFAATLIHPAFQPENPYGCLWNCGPYSSETLYRQGFSLL